MTAIVALRKESVDRNSRMWDKTILPVVALRKESVDRNHADLRFIEIFCNRCNGDPACVALRKESVDRNYPRYGPQQP